MRRTNVKRIALALALLGGVTLAGAGGVAHASPTHIDVGYVDNDPSTLRISGGGFAPGDTINLSVYALPHGPGAKPLITMSVRAQPATTTVCGYYGSYGFCYDAPNPFAGAIRATASVNPDVYCYSGSVEVDASDPATGASATGDSPYVPC